MKYPHLKNSDPEEIMNFQTVGKLRGASSSKMSWGHAFWVAMAIEYGPPYHHQYWDFIFSSVQPEVRLGFLGFEGFAS